MARQCSWDRAMPSWKREVEQDGGWLGAGHGSEGLFVDLVGSEDLGKWTGQVT